MHDGKVTQVSPAPSVAVQAHFAALLAMETDPADVMADIAAAGSPEAAGFVLVDVRSKEAYCREHASGAVNIPHAELTAARLEAYGPQTLFVVYCWSPGCNGAAKAALRLAQLERPVKMLQGGLEYWKREGGPLAGEAAGPL